MITQPDKEYFANGFTAETMINVQMISQPMRLVTAVGAAEASEGRGDVIVIRQRRAEWEQRLPEVRAILERGTAEARRVGEQTMQEVRRAMRIDYFD